MPVRSLPRDPNVEQLRNLAKTLQRLVREGEPGAVDLVREFHPRFANLAAGSPELTRFTRADMQLTLARSYGFPSWPKLRGHIETVNRLSRNPHLQPVGNPISNGAELIDEFLRLACLTYGADDPARPERARALLAEHPELASATIHTAAAVGDVAAAQALLAADSAQARFEGGPYRWEPSSAWPTRASTAPAPGHSPLEVARLLLDVGADPNAGYLWESEYPFTALTGAFGDGESGRNTPPHRDSLQLARLLLEAGADPNDSQTLYNRQWRPDDTHLQLLLDHGLGEGTATVWHTRLGLAHPTPQELVEEELRSAAKADRIQRVRMLINRVDDIDGIGCDHPTLEGRTAHQLAVLHGTTEIATLLERAGATPERSAPSTSSGRVHPARPHRSRTAPRRRSALAPQLIDACPDLVANAVELQRIDAIRLLIDIGFNLNPTDRRTPLHEAAFHGHLDLVRALIDLGADPPSPTPTTTAPRSAGPGTTNNTTSPNTSPRSRDPGATNFWPRSEASATPGLSDGVCNRA